MIQKGTIQDLLPNLEILLRRDYTISSVALSTPYADVTLLRTHLNDAKIFFVGTRKLGIKDKQDNPILMINYYGQNWYIDILPSLDEFYLGFFGDEFSSEKAELRIKILFKN